MLAPPLLNKICWKTIFFEYYAESAFNRHSCGGQSQLPVKQFFHAIATTRNFCCSIFRPSVHIMNHISISFWAKATNNTSCGSATLMVVSYSYNLLKLTLLSQSCSVWVIYYSVNVVVWCKYLGMYSWNTDDVTVKELTDLVWDWLRLVDNKWNDV